MRSSNHQRRASGTVSERSPQVSAVGEPLPARDVGRDALALEVDGDRRADRGQAGVAAGVEGRVGGQRGELGQVRAQRVVDRQRAVGAAERDVQVQAGDELAARALAVLVERAHVARVVGEHAEFGGDRVRARRSSAGRYGSAAAARSRRAAASAATAVATSGHGGVTISSCAAGSSSLKRGSPPARLEHLARVRQQVERLGVEQEELLLDADPELVRRVEAGAQGVGVHVAQPPWSKRRVRTALERVVRARRARRRRPRRRPAARTRSASSGGHQRRVLAEAP